MRFLLLAFCVLSVNAADHGERWWRHVRYLADDSLEGRLTGSAGHRKAAEYVAAELEKAGVRPAGTKGYFQPVKFRSRRIVEQHSTLALTRGATHMPLVLGEDAIVNMRVEPAPVADQPLVFAGYGLRVPEAHYDDLAGLDLRGKIAVVLSGGPPAIAGPLRAHHQSLEERTKLLRRQAGAFGMVTIPNPKEMDIPWARVARNRFQPAMSLADAAFSNEDEFDLAVTFNPERAEKLFEGSGHTFRELLALADAGKPLPRFPLAASLNAKLASEYTEVESQNVAGVLPGTDPKLKNEYVALSAHLDHLGVGEPVGGDRIYNGAMDNASGVASLLDMAEALKGSGSTLRRSLLFVFVTGEEKGLLGSRYFAQSPTVDAAEIVADLNVDMFLPLFPLRLLTVYGLNESDLGAQVRAVAQRMGVKIQDDLEPQRNIFIRSDQYSFILRGVPALSFKVGYEPGSAEERIAKTWLKERYHAPSDDIAQPVDKTCASRFDDLILELAKAVADRQERPRWLPASFFKRFSR